MVFRSSFALGAAISLAVAAVTSGIRSFSIAVVDLAVGFGRLLIEIVALPNESRFALPEGYVDYADSGQPLDSSLLQSMRHEAGMRTRAASRHQ